MVRAPFHRILSLPHPYLGGRPRPHRIFLAEAIGSGAVASGGVPPSSPSSMVSADLKGSNGENLTGLQRADGEVRGEQLCRSAPQTWHGYLTGVWGLLLRRRGALRTLG